MCRCQRGLELVFVTAPISTSGAFVFPGMRGHVCVHGLYVYAALTSCIVSVFFKDLFEEQSERERDLPSIKSLSKWW